MVRSAYGRVSRGVLERFDQPGGEVLNLAALLELARRASGGEERAVRAAVTQLIADGYLRCARTPDAFVRTEDGRLALAGPRELTLYTRPGCHLCEEAKAQLAPFLREFCVRLREVNIDADPVLRERYTNDVPVIWLGARKIAKHRIDVCQLRRQLAAAAGR